VRGRRQSSLRALLTCRPAIQASRSQLGMLCETVWRLHGTTSPQPRCAMHMRSPSQVLGCLLRVDGCQTYSDVAVTSQQFQHPANVFQSLALSSKYLSTWYMQWLPSILPVGQANINHLETAVHTADTNFMQEPKHELLHSRHANVASTPTYVHRIPICHLPTCFVSSALCVPTCL
jgi:hypothetical protein